MSSFQAGFKGASFDILLDESFDYARAAGFGSVSQTCTKKIDFSL